ncbi:MAG: TetR/AcrR family transcriptional regulator [Sandaracinaceae bacterium]
MAERKRKRNREGTRDRMLEAAADLLRQEGLTSLTTVRITKEAGIVQSGFYAHFKNPEHLQQELAERAGRDLRERMALWMAALRAGESDLAALAKGYREVLGVFDADRALVDLFLRYRRSPSPLGIVLGHLHTQLRADFFQFVRERAGDPDVVRPHLGTIGLHADALVAALLGMAEGVVDGRIGDLDGAAEELARLTLAPLSGLLA